MRFLVAGAAAAFVALSIPSGPASAAMPAPGVMQANHADIIQADWNGRPAWHHHWHHEWREHYRPQWHPYWHHHWHHGWDRPYGYQYNAY